MDSNSNRNQDARTHFPSAVGNTEIPLGMGMALAQNLPALQRFALLPPATQKKLIEGAKNQTDRDAMKNYVASIEGMT